MSGTESVLVLVVVPATIVAVISTLAYLSGPRVNRRYRPGRAYEFPPVWYIANHHSDVPDGRPATGADELTGPEPGRDTALQGTTGGASDQW